MRSEGDFKGGYIYDFLSVDDGSVIRALLYKGLSYLTSEGVDWVKCGVLENSLLYRTLISLRFRRGNEENDIVYEILDEKIDETLTGNLERWYVTLSETDWLGW